MKKQFKGFIVELWMIDRYQLWIFQESLDMANSITDLSKFDSNCLFNHLEILAVGITNSWTTIISMDTPKYHTAFQS